MQRRDALLYVGKSINGWTITFGNAFSGLDGGFGDLAQKMGGTLKDVYWTTGPYDVVSVAEFPDDETGTAFLLALGSQGNIRSTTLRAFNQDEMAGVLAKLS